MTTRTTTFRLHQRHLRQLGRLADEMACSNTDVLRIALDLLKRPEHADFRRSKRAEMLAWRFRDRLVRRYGIDTIGEIYLRGYDDSPALALGDVEPDDARLEIRRSEQVVHLDLIDASNEGDPDQIGIYNFQVVDPEDVENGNSITFRLADISVYGDRPDDDDRFGFVADSDDTEGAA